MPVAKVEGGALGAGRGDAAPRSDLPATTAPALAVDAAGRSYGGVEALAPLSLSIATGERVAVVGPSGAGKSTLLRLLNTSLAPSTGAVHVLGHRVDRLAPGALRAVRARVGTIYQQLLLVPQSSVMQNVVAGRLGRVSLARALWSLVSRSEAERVHAVLDAVGIAHKLHERVDRLSGGEQQRVAIARALYQDPEIIIADEPLASVDPARAAEIIELLARAFAGRTLVVTTHRIEPLLPHVGRVIGLRGGALAFDKPAAALTLDDLGRLYESRRAARAPPPPPSAPRPSPAAAAGALAVGASSTPGELLLPAAVREFVRAYPGVRVSLAIKDSAEITADLLAGTVELGFVGARSPHPGLVYEDFVEDEIVVVAAPGVALPPEPVPASVLATLPRVDREAGSGTRAVVEDHLANMGVPLDPGAVALEVGTLVGLKAAVLSGIGIAFTSRSAVVEEVEGGHLRIVRVEGLRVPRRIFAAYRAGEELSVGARTFLAVARAACGARLGRVRA
jgi:phosphonate transport system ATP-binding protein